MSNPDILPLKEINLNDSATGKESVKITRYLGALSINKMIEEEHYIEAYAHTQLGIEKILWDKIAGVFQARKHRKYEEE
jgi:hypothetical protein